MEENKESPQEPVQPEQNADSAQPQTPPLDQPAEKPGKDACTWAMLCHLLAIFTSFIAPLVIWLIKKDEDPFVNKHGKEALNFQITVAIAGFVSSLLTVICIGVPMLIAVGIANLVLCIVAAVKASEGKDYRYPVSIRFIR